MSRLTLDDEAAGVRTYLDAQDYPGLLAELVEGLPKDRELRSAKVHTAADEKLVLDVFHFGPPGPRFDPNDPEQAAKLKQTVEFIHRRDDSVSEARLRKHFVSASAEYLLSVPPLRHHENYRLYESVHGTEDTVVRSSAQHESNLHRISVATGNADARQLFERIVGYLGRVSIDIHRAFLDLFEDAQSRVLVLGFVVQKSESYAFAEDSPAWKQLRRDLSRLRWLDQRAIDVAAQTSMDLLSAEVAVALVDLVHPLLAREDAYAFSRDRLMDLLFRHQSLAGQIAQLFLSRFDPKDPLSDNVFEAHIADLSERLEKEVDAEYDRRFYACLVKAVRATLRTNVHVEGRYALSIRLNPEFVTTKERPIVPFGVFFVHGRAFAAYHVRFRDIARGGVRVVRPRGAEEHALEAERVYNEVYDLAFAQQLKNKDIPEGGSKAVILAEPDAAIDDSVKAFADAILDLICTEEGLTSRIIDHYGQPELLYLGPDENISPELIVWVVERARRRGYAMPDAFMSSKPGAGINHKEFGVTSEGVTVFLEEALRSVGIDPRKQPFTVKITGGPDGDVAGNEIKILHREFGEHARIVGIADASGSGRDPDGLDHAELRRLVEQERPIADFARAKLGPHGRVVALDEPDGIQLRNNMHLDVLADAFIPAGGRPQTIHIGNWSRYLNDGKPSSKVIVEGANLFITPDARERLAHDAGVVIIKDSSANKCGVICSSYEIAASMLLSPDELLAIKETFVDQVLQKLRHLARREAQLLFREQTRSPQMSMPELSVTLSRAITRAHDAIEGVLQNLNAEDRGLAQELVLDHLPDVLVKTAKARIEARLPARYRDGIVASSLAARIVYREGIAFMANLPEDHIAAQALAYLRGERETAHLVERVLASDLPDRTRIAQLLEIGGPRSLSGSV